MRFYTNHHKFYCGIDLHAKNMYVCVLNEAGEIVLHRDIKTDSEVLLKTIAPFREDVLGLLQSNPYLLEKTLFFFGTCTGSMMYSL